MFKFALLVTMFAIIGITISETRISAAGGTMVIAEKGQPAHIAADWPERVGELINDPCRTGGWHSWFSEWPNDVNQYGFEITCMADVNRLIQKLARVKTDMRQIRLCHLKEPKSLGWVTSLPDGNNTAVMFSIGNQLRIDQWYKHVRKPFGNMVFLDAPIAVPPTLTIFVQNEAVDLDKLQIPEGITVESGCVPTVFHRFNTTQEKEQLAKTKAAPSNQNLELDARSQAVAQKIAAFMQKQRESKETK